MSRLIVGPFNRVEGDLEVTLDIDAGRVTSAHVNSPMYRGFEQILQATDHEPESSLIFLVSQRLTLVRAYDFFLGRGNGVASRSIRSRTRCNAGRSLTARRNSQAARTRR